MNAMKGRTTMKKKIRIFALLLVVAMLLSAFAYAHEETDSAKIHLTGETLSEADDVQAIGNRAIFISTQNKIASVDDSQQEYVAEYVPEYQIEFAIPYQNKGVMIGSEKPTMHSVQDLSLRKSLRTSRWYGDLSGLWLLRKYARIDQHRS
jgi:hypothetical protein